LVAGLALAILTQADEHVDFPGHRKILKVVEKIFSGLFSA
jgi:hypothetical protein